MIHSVSVDSVCNAEKKKHNTLMRAIVLFDRRLLQLYMYLQKKLKYILIITLKMDI